MKTRIDYGAWINDKHVVMTRKQWLASIRLVFPGSNIADIKQEITTKRLTASKSPLYHPEKNTGWSVPYVFAYYHVTKDKQWWYIQIDNKMDSVIHALIKLLNMLDFDYKTLNELKDWNADDEKQSILDPAWIPKQENIILILDELTDVNYHALRGEVEDMFTQELIFKTYRLEEKHYMRKF